MGVEAMKCMDLRARGWTNWSYLNDTGPDGLTVKQGRVSGNWLRIKYPMVERVMNHKLLLFDFLLIIYKV